MEKKFTNRTILKIMSIVLPIAILAVTVLAVYTMWEPHNPNRVEMNMAAQTETQSPPETETETETEAETESTNQQLLARVEEKLGGMTLEEKVAQLFVITPDALTGVEGVTAAGDTSREAYHQYPVGGLIYFDSNIYTESQLKEMLASMSSIGKERTGVAPFLAVDEEGGQVARLANHFNLNVENTGNLLAIGNTGDTAQAYEAGRNIGSYLKEYGFNLDFAPDADVLDSLDNQVIGDRSFGTDGARVAEMVREMVKGMEEAGISATLKHFPGHGSTAQDTHTDYAYNNKTLEELEQSDFLPFRAGIQAGADFVMVGHLSVPNAAGEDVQSIFSSTVVKDWLREKMGFEGVVITDAMNMDAISVNYDSGSAAVKALQAGVDMLLMPADFHSAYSGVLSAVAEGTLTEARINESVKRILKIKMEKEGI